MDSSEEDKKVKVDIVENNNENFEFNENAKCLNEAENSNCTKDSFRAYIVKQTVSSVKISWNLIAEVHVYEIEKFHKRRGWEQVAWKCQGPTTIENLEDNFAYRLRIKALHYDEIKREYKIIQISEDFIVRTLAAQPTNLCLNRAIKKGQQFLVKRILRRRPSLILYPGPNGFLPLANAIAYGENCVFDVLLTAGACVHTGNTNNGRTPLHLAFFHGRLPVARILLNKKAQLDASDTNGMTACHFAIDANQFEMLKFGLENRANLEATDACGWTLLLRAVVMGADITILKLLVMHGADRNVKDKLGQTCIDLARLYHNDEAKKYFEHLHKSKKLNKK